MRPGMFHRDGPKGMTKEELKALLPRIGDTRMETPTICDVSNRPLPQKCVVVEVHPKHLWYTVVAPDERAECMAVCAMADALAYFTAAQNGAGGVISSASIGSVSVSYGGAAGTVDLSPRGQSRELFRCACQHLNIYRGVGGC